MSSPAFFRMVLLLALPGLLSAADLYVSTNGAAVPPFADWANASTNIQVAVDAAAPGDTVIVGDGVYTGTVQYLVVITNDITLISQNGPDTTIIDCKGGTVNTDRHALWIKATATGAVVSGFAMQGCNHSTAYGYAGVWMQAGTITNCIIRNNLAGGGGQSGGIRMYGGLLTDSVISNNVCVEWQLGNGGGLFLAGGTVERCLITENESRSHPGGAGVYMTGGVLRNSLIVKNRSTYFDVARDPNVHLGEAGGVRMTGGRIENCTIADNTAMDQGAGLYATGGAATNCIIARNTSPTRFTADRWDLFTNTAARVGYACTPYADGPGFVAGDPHFADPTAGDYSLLPGSPAIDAGTNLAFAADMQLTPRPQGAAWDIGALEAPATADRPFTVHFEAAPREAFDTATVTFTAFLGGANTNVTWYRWTFGDGAETAGPDLGTVSHVYTAGWHTVSLTVSNTSLETASYTNSAYVRIHPSILHVDKTGSHTHPFDTAAKAATNIEAAVSAAAPGATVRVGNGIWAMARQVNLEKPIRVASVNGPANCTSTVPGQVRSFYLYHTNAVLDGFTLTTSAAGNHTMNGAGVYMLQGLVTNCVFRNIVIGGQGAGVWMAGGTVSDCTIVSNRTYEWQYGYGGGAFIANNTFHGPALIENSRILHNESQSFRGGGGLYMNRGTVRNCLIASNKCTRTNAGSQGIGGGVYMSGGLLENCTVATNFSVSSGGGLYINGAAGVTNCIVQFNTVSVAPAGERNLYNSGGAFGYSCIDPAPAGTANTSLDPRFTDADAYDFTLLPDSPCVDQGTNQAWMTGARDLAGDPRLQNGTVDMGCFESPDPSSGPLVCNFSATPVEAFLAAEVVFTAEPVGLDTNITYYWWTFGDGQTTEGADKAAVTNLYQPGYYDVTLVMVNQSSEYATNTKAAFIKVAPAVAHVSTNGTAVPPYTSWETAAASIQDALAVVGRDDAGNHTVVAVTSGIYQVNSQIALTTNTTIRGVGRPEDVVLQGASSRIFFITSPGVTLDGLTIRGGYEASHLALGGGIHMTGGLITNCIIRECHAGGSGGGLYMDGGTVTHCTIQTNLSQEWQHGRGGGVFVQNGVLEYSVIASNRTTSWYGGGGLYQAGGAVRNCLIAHNWADCYNNNEADGGGAVIAGGRFENNTVTENWAEDGGGGLLVTGGGITNCIVFGNTAAQWGTSSGKQDIEGATTGIGYSCSPDLTDGVNNNLTADPLFADPLDANFRLTRQSPAIEAGLLLPWMTSQTADLDGRPRVQGKRPDLGAYEADAPRTGALLMIY